MTQWEQFNFEDRIKNILRDVKYYAANHHFKRPFFTPYQIAIEFAQRYPEDFVKIGLSIGGRATGQRNSLSQYIAGQLSTRIKSGEISDVEGGFISNRYLVEISFQNNDETIISSLTKTEYDLSMFRMKED